MFSSLFFLDIYNFANSSRAKKTREFDDLLAKRLELRGGVDPDDHSGEAFEEETVEFLVKEESTVMQD